MNIVIVASHAWSLPSAARTGDSQIILDLSRSLAECGHSVSVCAPAGSVMPQGVRLLAMPVGGSRFDAEPAAAQCELTTIAAYKDDLSQADVIHDCSVLKLAAREFQSKSLATVWGGAPTIRRNVVAQSQAQAGRLLRGETDYVGTATPAAGGPGFEPLTDVRWVWNGISTDAPTGYAPTGKPKQDHFLMLGRWHPVRGIEQAIELAKRTGVNLLIAGTDPSEDHPAQADYARKICAMARGCDNINVEFLPPDPNHHARKVELYSDARALLFLPQFAEPFGLSQIEAMACGTAVIAPDIGSCKEVLGVVGVEEGIATLTEQVDGFPLEDFIAVQGRACRQRACEQFDRMVMAEGYLGLYYEILNGRSWG